MIWMEGAAIESVEAVRSSGGQGIAVRGDVTEAAFPTKLADAAVAHFGSIDISSTMPDIRWGHGHSEDHGRTVPGHARHPSDRSVPDALGRINWIREAAKEGNGRTTA